MTTNKVSHRVSWYVYVDGQRIRRTASMRGAWAYDVECSCGWYTRTGGAVKSYVDSLVWEHKHGFGNDNYSI